jgi:16S rRNA (uracil1498-N3)-methyltransferase
MVGAADHPQREVGFRLDVASPLPKGDREQFLVEKLTELGVTSFVPLGTQRSVIEPSESKLEKLRRHVIEASKQSGRNALMKVESPVEWDIYCRRAHLPQLRVLGHPGRSHNSWPASVDVALAVGPEGGFTDAEVEKGREAGWQVVDLGPRILRVETAAIVLATLALPRG